jgi:hypothetical protein
LLKWRGNIYIPTGVNSIYEYNTGTGVPTDLSPASLAAGDTDYDGQIQALCADYNYLYVAVDDGSDTQILAGAWETIDGDTDWSWQAIHTKAIDPTAMLVSNKDNSVNRLYVGTDTATDGLIPYVCSTSYTDVLSESGYTFHSSGDIIFPWITTNFGSENKYWAEKKVTSKCITDKTTITVYYQTKGGSWTSLGNCTQSALDGTDYPAETTDTFTIKQTSERIRFKLHLATSDSAYTPILYGEGGGYNVTSKLILPKIKQAEFVVRLADEITCLTGAVYQQTVANQIADLRTLDGATTPITLVGIDGTSRSVFIKIPEELSTVDEISKESEYQVNIEALTA